MARTLAPILLLCDKNDGTIQAVQKAVLGTAQCEVVATEPEACDWLSLQRPHVVIIDMRTTGAQRVCASLRADASRARVPIIALAPQLADLTFAEAFSWGGDDVVDLAHMAGITPRVRGVPDALTGEPQPRGRVIVADTDRLERIAWGRLLRAAGYIVHFADNADGLHDAIAASPTSLVVAHADLPPKGELANEIRAESEELPWIVCAPPKTMATVRAAMAGLRNVGLHDTFTAADNILFIANDLAQRDVVGLRSSRRVLYGTLVWMRRAGGDEDVIGYTYNVSQGGLFVRSLFNFDRGEDVWVELVPPRNTKRVRLFGKARWRATFSSTDESISPSGFGIQLSAGLGTDMDTYADGCNALAAELGIEE